MDVLEKYARDLGLQEIVQFLNSRMTEIVANTMLEGSLQIISSVKHVAPIPIINILVTRMD